MENRIQVLIEEIEQIRTQYIQEVGAGGRKVWPRAIKDRVLELDRLTQSTKRTADLSGFSVDTLYVWRAEIRKNFKQLPVVKNKSVTVTDIETRKLAKTSETLKFVTVTVTTPKGYRFEGFSPEFALELLFKMEAR